VSIVCSSIETEDKPCATQTQNGQPCLFTMSLHGLLLEEMQSFSRRSVLANGRSFALQLRGLEFLREVKLESRAIGDLNQA
jgi:hypothetical protein